MNKMYKMHTFLGDYSIQADLVPYFRGFDKLFDQHPACAAASAGTRRRFEIAKLRGLRRLDRGKQIVLRNAETRADER